MRDVSFNVGLWGTPQQDQRTWIVDSIGKPVAMVDEIAERSVQELSRRGFVIVPALGESIESLTTKGYLER